MAVSTAKKANQISEMHIVDTCTRLIFGEHRSLSKRERLIVDAISLSNEALRITTLPDMGQHMRQMGVDEMIALVAATKRCLDSGRASQ